MESDIERAMRRFCFSLPPGITLSRTHLGPRNLSIAPACSRKELRRETRQQEVRWGIVRPAEFAHTSWPIVGSVLVRAAIGSGLFYFFKVPPLFFSILGCLSSRLKLDSPSRTHNF